MKLVALAAVTLLAVPAFAETPRAMRGETIRIQGKGPPKVPPRPMESYHRIAPRYSDAAILENRWAKAWLLVDIDENGGVERLKLLKKPGHDLDAITVERGFEMRFDPARDGHGQRTRSQLVIALEWPSYWWVVSRRGIQTGVPAFELVDRVPCAGSGPLNLHLHHAVYRDCSPVPDLRESVRVPWITRPVPSATR